jgi:hypothetical protein
MSRKFLFDCLAAFLADRPGAYSVRWPKECTAACATPPFVTGFGFVVIDMPNVRAIVKSEVHVAPMLLRALVFFDHRRIA